ncbi:hypothetical protein BS50DRAFT_355685 [Corynespora cassiicola Philippines]|uniref:Uncharacterized protein n=1 Tax=Corynespora cassiicola Philippines TaxID=1448308 RepID=A0A2T2NRG0_CORCC|nr:hypothetical protein BS50DRAFT_355685 [Corynespora cassiicola Philippines]
MLIPHASCVEGDMAERAIVWGLSLAPIPYLSSQDAGSEVRLCRAAASLVRDTEPGRRAAGAQPSNVGGCLEGRFESRHGPFRPSVCQRSRKLDDAGHGWDSTVAFFCIPLQPEPGCGTIGTLRKRRKWKRKRCGWPQARTEKSGAIWHSIDIVPRRLFV